MLDFNGSKLKLNSIDKQKVLFIHSKDLYAAVSYTKHSEFEDTPENIELHEKIINKVAAKCNVLPFQFNTIVGETIGQGVLSKNYNKIVELLKILGGKSEFIISVYKQTNGIVVEDLTKIKKSRSIFSKTPIRDNKVLKTGLQKITARLHSELNKNAFDSKYEKVIPANTVFQGTYLVDNEKTRKFEESFKWVKSLYSEFDFQIKGPRPPYSFNDISIKSSKSKLYGKIYK